VPIKLIMVTLSLGMEIVLLFAVGVTAVAMLNVFGNVISHETQIHDLRNQVQDLHYRHALYLARLDSQIGEEGEVEILPDTGETIDCEELDESAGQAPISEAQSLPDGAEPAFAQAA